MITDLLINVLLFLPYQLLQSISGIDINLSMPDEVFSAFETIVSCVGYLFPVSIFIICFTVKLTIRFWSIPYAIILRIKSFIPTMGD